MSNSERDEVLAIVAIVVYGLLATVGWVVGFVWYWLREVYRATNSNFDLDETGNVDPYGL